MALRSVMHSHLAGIFPRDGDGVGFSPRFSGLGEGNLNLPPDSALAIPRHPADLSFFDQAVSVRAGTR